jgi:hypothetical protein
MADEPTYTAPVAEIPASPSGPPSGSDAPDADSDFIMSTLFGQDEPAKAPVSSPKPAGDQGDTGTKPDGGTDTGTAPPTPAPAAKEPAAVPQELSPVPGAQSSQPGKEQTPPAEPAPKTPAPGSPPAAAEPAPAETRLTPEERLQLASVEALRQQNQQLLNLMQQQSQPQGQPQSQGQPPAQPSGGPAIEQVHLTVPDALYDAVFAEDPAMSKRGLNVLVSSIATAAVNNVLQKVVPIVDQRLAGYDQSTRAATTAQSQEEDYYKAFPAHRNPLFRTAIEAEMQKMAQEMPAAPWNDDFRNALGTRVNRTLQLLGIPVGMVPGAEQQQGQPAPAAAGFGAQPQGGNGAAPPAPAPMLDSSNRGAAPESAGNFIAATFS